MEKVRSGGGVDVRGHGREGEVGKGGRSHIGKFWGRHRANDWGARARMMRWRCSIDGYRVGNMELKESLVERGR